jgi:cation transport ATPase
MARNHPHQPLQQRLSRRHELWVYATGGVLALSGIGALLCEYLLRTGPEPHPLEVWWLRLHGAALLGFLIVFGTVLPAHARGGWLHRMNRGTGVPLLVLMGLLVLSGYGLYYLVDERWRAVTSNIHWILGLAAIGLLAAHALLGKRTARRPPR